MEPVERRASARFALLEPTMTAAQRRAASLDAARKINDAAKAENRGPTDVEMAQIEKHIADADAAKAEHESAVARAATLARLESAEPIAPASLRGLGVTPPASAREGFLEDPMRGFKSHRDFFMAVKNAGHGGKVSANLKSLSARFGCQADGSPVLQATAGSDEQSGFSDPYGGFLVPKETAPGVLSIGAEGNMLATFTRKIPMASPKVAFNARVDKDHTTSVSGGLLVYRRAEASAVTAKRVQFEQVDLNADPLMGISYSTEELLSDSPVSIAAMLEEGFQAEFAAKIVKEILNGTGAGEYLGVRRSGALVTVSKETGQAVDTITWANLIKMRARCWGYGNAVWVANPDTLPALMSITQPGSTVPMFTQDAMGVERLFGRPIIFTEFAETLGDLGDLLLLNLNEYLEGEYEPITGVTSMHVRFVEHEMAFKFTKRCAGSPWWRTALTPAKGSNTLSPFVVLEAR